MKSTPSYLTLVCRYALMLALPIVLTLLNVRLLMTPAFPEIEYNLPGFPADAYGFTKADRLQWSKIAIDYLLNAQGIEFLGNLRFPEGQAAPPESQQYYLPPRDSTYLYNDRELEHMLDVKNVTQAALAVLLAASVISLAAMGALSYLGEVAALRSGLLFGAGLTAAIYLGILLYVALNFNGIFVQFHKVFFESGTWMFLWSDTLIRLFPVRFWQDAFTFIGLASLLEAGGVAAWAWWGVK